MEVRQEDVPPASLPPRPGDPEVQHPGLQTAHGAIPESHPEGPAGSTYAETKGLRFQPGGREPEPCAAGVRHDEGEGSVRRDGEFETGRGEGKVEEEVTTMTLKWNRGSGIKLSIRAGLLVIFSYALYLTARIEGWVTLALLRGAS